MADRVTVNECNFDGIGLLDARTLEPVRHPGGTAPQPPSPDGDPLLEILGRLAAASAKQSAGLERLESLLSRLIPALAVSAPTSAADGEGADGD